jgi:hypothetical protein
MPLQMAAMLILHPERGDNAMHKHIPVLKTPEFKRFIEKMKLALANLECPTDYKLEAVLPGVQQQFQTMESRMGGMQRTMGTMETKVVTAVRDEGKRMKDLIATGFEEAANLFKGGGGSRAASASASAQTTRTSTMAGSAGELAFTELQFYGNHRSVQSMYNEYYGKGDFKLFRSLEGYMRWSRSLE